MGTYYQERVVKLAKQLQGDTGEPLEDCVAKVFAERPELYVGYREETTVKQRPSETSESQQDSISGSKTVGLVAAEGIAKQLVEKRDAKNMDEGLAQAFRMTPDLYEMHRREVLASR